MKLVASLIIGFGVFLFTHAVFYAFTGLTFWAPTGNDVDRQVALVSVHAVVFFASLFCVIFWTEFFPKE